MKTTPEAHTSLLDHSSEDLHSQYKPPNEHGKTYRASISGAYTKIAVAGVATTVPFAVCCAILLGLIFGHRVQNDSSMSANLRLSRNNEERSVYLVNYSATRLTTVASWTSTVAAIMPGFVMTLFSFRLARKMLKDFNPAGPRSLPTPYQLGLLLDTFQGGPMALWNGLTYVLWKRRNRLNRLLLLAFSGLTLGLILSLMIWAADTWFHVAVSTVPFSQVSQLSTPRQKFGTQFPSECVGFLDAERTGVQDRFPNFYACSDRGIHENPDAYSIVHNVSDTYRLLSGSFNSSQFSFLAPPNPPSNLDFSTSTIAASASCEPITQRCDLQVPANGSPNCDSLGFNCSSNFRGSFNTSDSTMRLANTSTRLYDNHNGCMATFDNNSLLNNIYFYDGVNGAPTDTDLNVLRNPYYASIAGQVDYIAGDPNLVDADHNVLDVCESKIFILGCEVTLYNMDYTWVNSSLKVIGLTPSDLDTTFFSLAAFSGRLFLAQLSYAINLATTQSKTADSLALNYGKTFEQTLLAFSANIWDPLANAEEQLRSTILVAKVPKAPLFTLISLCLLFVLMAVALLIITLTGQTVDVQNVQARLNVYGVIASHFESIERTSAPVSRLEDVFEERGGNETMGTRVAIARSDEGGWIYVSSREQECGKL